MMIYLDKKREKFSQWLKRNTTLDFSDWCVILLFVVGTFGIFYISPAELSQKVSDTILWFTAIVIVQYTKETYWLKQVSVKQLEYQKRPILKILPKSEWAASIGLKNIGKGPALNIELRISQIHSSGGFTNLRNLIAEEDRRQFFNLGEGEEYGTGSLSVLEAYQKALGSDYSYGQKGVFAIISTYEDISRNRFYTISLFKTKEGGVEHILKTTKTGSYASGELEKVFPKDWIS
jgi:hypothetical protein